MVQNEPRMKPEKPPPGGELILYQTEDGQTRIACRFADENVWMTQALMAELFQKDVRTINEHIQNIFVEGELPREATIRKFRIVRSEGNREVAREIEHYNLEAIIAVGYRVKSPRGTQFRQWATARLKEYLVKGFTMDDERLKDPPGKGHVDYFDELLARIRDIRASERRVYLRVREILALAADYEPDEPATQVFSRRFRTSCTSPPRAKRRRNSSPSVPTPRSRTWDSPHGTAAWCERAM